MGGCCVMNNFIGDFFRDIFCSDGGGGCSYHPSSVQTDNHAKKVADELAQMKENIRKSCEKDEKKIMEDINRGMDNFITELGACNKKTYGGKSLNINIKNLQDKSDELKKEIIGFVGDRMDEQLVLTNAELSTILEERNDSKRAKNFDEFCIRIKKEALGSLGTKIEKTVRKQEAMVRKEIEVRLEEVDKSMNEALKSYSELLDIKGKDTEKLQEQQMQYIYKYELFDIFLDELKVEE